MNNLINLNDKRDELIKLEVESLSKAIEKRLRERWIDEEEFSKALILLIQNLSEKASNQ